MTTDTQQSEIKTKIEALNKKYKKAKEALKTDRTNAKMARRLYDFGHKEIDVESIDEKVAKSKEQMGKVRKQMAGLKKEFLAEALTEWNEITGQGRKKKETKAA